MIESLFTSDVDFIEVADVISIVEESRYAQTVIQY
jgi:hypothetical protein